MKERINIAVAFSGINDEYQGKMCWGISQRVGENDNITVAYFAPFNTDLGVKELDSAENTIFSLINFDFFDVLIVVPSNFSANTELLERIIKEAKDKNVPVFSMDSELEGCVNILIDNAPAIRKIADHLIDVHGARDIIYVGGVKGKPYCKEKLDEFKASLAAHGIEFDENHCLWGEFYDIAVRKELKKYLDGGGKLPDAFFCANDAMALGVCYELEERGYSIPDDVIITGFDGFMANLVHDPTITTVEVPYKDLGYNTVSAVIDYLENGVTDPEVLKKKYMIKSEPSFYGSCGCLSDDKVVRNAITKRLSNDSYRKNYMNSYLIRMSTVLSSCDNFSEYFEVLKKYVDEMQVDSVYFCYSEEYTKQYDKDDPFLVDYTIPEKTEISDKICAKIVRVGEQIKEPVYFNKKDILPDLHTDNRRSKEFLFTPLHFLSRTYGYVACEVRGDLQSSNSALFNLWVNYIAIAHDSVREKLKSKRYTAILEELYNRDFLTKLFNRRGLFAEINSKLSDISKNQRSVMVFIADLDDMKGINDNYGHSAGDIALLIVSRSLEEILKPDDFACRYGGDEFVVFGIGYDESEAKDFGRRFEKTVKFRSDRNGAPYTVKASYGYYISKDFSGVETFDSLVSKADQRMYISKQIAKSQKQTS